MGVHFRENSREAIWICPCQAGFEMAFYGCEHGYELCSFSMQVTLKLPDEIAEGLGKDAEIPQRVLEALVLQKYLTQQISLGRLTELLGFNRWEAEAFLDRNNSRLPYTLEMLEEDRRHLAEVFA
ncbi:MAG TPA: UPF0175 family protein [Candidatus Saccharimonadales bacterium]|nr:UPF0175 family protein [Candidatus Saccharimonadales bacterium]